VTVAAAILVAVLVLLAAAIVGWTAPGSVDTV
jgi:hypothetical protein